MIKYIPILESRLPECAVLSGSEVNITGLTGPVEHGDRPQPGRERLRSGMRTLLPSVGFDQMSALALEVSGLAFGSLAGVHLTQARRSLVGLHIIR